MRKTALIILLVLCIVSVVSAGGYADPKSFEEWRPATIAQADSMNTVGLFNRAIVHLSGLYQSAVAFNYHPMTNSASPVYVAEEWSYGGYPHLTDADMGPISNRCGQ